MSSCSSYLLLICAIALICLLNSSNVSSQPVEEFQIHGPMDLNNLALNAFVELRKVEPEANMDANGTFMSKARAHAVRRMVVKSEEELTVLGALGVGENGEISVSEQIGNVLKLPAPEGQTAHIVAAANAQSSYEMQLLPEENKANALTFIENVGMGAISRAGALTMGDDASWVKLAEGKVQRDAQLDYQALIWEYGSELAETAQKERGGLNITFEEQLLKNMEEWFLKGGGQLKFAKPTVTADNGFKLEASENLHTGDIIASIPFKLIMCRQTARNILISKRSKYLGDELAETFKKDEVLGMVIFLLHEYYKEINGDGSKWGPYLRTLRMRFLSTKVVQALKGTTTAQMLKKWFKTTDAFLWWTTGKEGPCVVTTGICKTKPNDKHGDSRFSLHQIRWAYWVVKQNAVRVRHAATGLDFIALIPYYNMVEKRIGIEGGVSFDFDGSISIRAGENHNEGANIGLSSGNITDSEYFLRYFSVPKIENPNAQIKLSLPGAIPKGSKFHYCMKGTSSEQRKDECMGSFKSESLFWKSKVLGEWRQMMNLPPRMQEIRMWANRLHLYGSDEEMGLINTANKMIAGLPIPVDQMPAEEQLMLMGVAKSADEAALMMVGSNEKPIPQLYSAPDPDEDPEAEKAMENLAFLAVQAQNVISSGNTLLNATKAVLNQTRDFFLHGILPKAGLDELDEFLLKKIGMISHCGFENNMVITNGHISDELMCAMRVHLMNESEIHVFCPKDVRVWEENCHNVEFMNFTAISEFNELKVIDALRNSIYNLLGGYSSTIEEDKEFLQSYVSSEEKRKQFGLIMKSAVEMRLREKEMLMSAVDYMNERENDVKNGSAIFQIEMKMQERVEADRREEEHKKYVAEIQRQAALDSSVAFVEVDMGSEKPRANLTLEEGRDVKDTVLRFCRLHGIADKDVSVLEAALRKRVVHPPPLSLFTGVVVPTGERRILAIPEHSNYTIEVGVFCAKYNVTNEQKCLEIRKHVENRLNSQSFIRNIIAVVPIDAPDSRSLKLIVREGEQHDLRQFVSDFFQLYHLPQESVPMMTQEVLKRLPVSVLQIPVNLHMQRQVSIRFAENDNVTAVVEGFVNFFEVDENAKIQILRRARSGMAPGTFLV